MRHLFLVSGWLSANRVRALIVDHFYHIWTDAFTRRKEKWRENYHYLATAREKPFVARAPETLSFSILGIFLVN